MRRPRLVATSVAAVVLALVAWIGWRLASGLRDAPAEKPGASAPGGNALSAAWSRIELPPLAASDVDKLRRKTASGQDRFLVEVLGDKIEARLGALREVFLRPRAAEAAADRVLAADFAATPLLPRRAVPRVERPGLWAEEGRDFGAPDVVREQFTGAVRRALAPVEELDRAELKVIAVEDDPSQSASAAAATASVLFFLAGSDAEGRRHQWSGEARLGFASGDWKLRRWETERVVHARIDALPFEDVTERALGGNLSYGALLAPSLDHFRARLDAATGIEVYGHNGLAVGDADGDGLEDLYVCMPGGLPNLLYRARADGTFEDASAASATDVLDGTSSALFLDLDNDGDQDLFLVLEESLHVLLNDGGGRFAELADAVPKTSVGRSTPVAAAAADYDLDGVLDVYVACYVFWRGGAGEVGTTLPVPYHEARNGAPNILLRGLGGGRFEDATERARLAAGNDRFSFAAAWADYDDDGDPDLYVANDFGSNNLYQNQGDGTFVDVAARCGVLDVGAGMSAAWADYDSDGDLDLYVGNMFSAAGRRVTSRSDYKAEEPELQATYRRHARGNSLFRNNGRGEFTDESLASGAYFGRWAWASDFVDFNLDGDVEIYVQNGFLSGPRPDDL